MATLKPEKDFTEQVDQQIPQAELLAKNNNLHGAIEQLALLEKQTRQASDLASTSRLLIAIVNICKSAGDWDLLSDQVTILSKKHGQLKQAIQKMVQAVIDILGEISNVDRKVQIIETLRTVTEGKIFVEVERARVTKILSDLKKDHYGDVKAAREILCELQVETFGSMDRKEKTEFILDQVALCIQTQDWTQAGILSRKISTKYLQNTADATHLKLRYFEQQVILAKSEDRYLDACKHYREVLEIPSVQENPDLFKATLARIIYFAILAPYDNEQHDLMHRIKADTRNSQVPLEAKLLEEFTVQELMRWPNVEQLYGPDLCQTDIFDAKFGSSTDPKAHQRWQDLRKRVIEHNVRVIAKYYTRIRMDRLTQHLDLTEDETEKYISDLVTSKMVYARIDRPARVVNFAKPRGTDDILNEWSYNMKDLLSHLGKIEHLITKDEMMASIQPSSKKGAKA
ncbi:hypothetical protein VSDG_09361 [Cytospora chrysosperma]|uniref:PCI domain-containing protein n=1 Tax=Cytospora chrysosperma TaxID=252740 RepID=A0A423VAY0_CYTCH|nr:hypothetical protein VSDG_09361 [Valsa sordida]